MSDMINELTKKCWLIKKAFKVDVDAFDEQLKNVLHLSEDIAPLLIAEMRKKMYGDLQKSLIKARKHSICFYADSFLLSYIALPIKEGELYKGMVVAGPFLNEPVSDSFLWKVMKNHQLENNWFKPLQNYYKSIPQFEETSFNIADVIVNIFANRLVETQIIPIQNSNGDIHSDELQPQDLDEKGMDIKLRYEIEKKYLHFVTIGDKEKALETIVDYTGDFSHRVPGNPLRARKNLIFSANTLNRIAADKGGVAPQYLHAISEKFAIKIEEAMTMSELHALEIAMTEEYCNAVRKLAIRGHSTVVKEAIMYINLHYNEPINLQIVAQKIDFNRTYLAKKFKEEMGTTVIDYINNKRIEEAAFLIEQGSTSITDISYLVGFSSYNYFCKVFKDVKRMTATEYKFGKRAET